MTSHKGRESVSEMETEENEQLSESYISIGLGLLVVVVVGVLLWNYLSQRNQPSEPQPTITQEATTAAQPGATYIVQEGDTLWSISEKSYGTGFNWTLIAEANNLSGDTALEAGQQLKIPETPEASATATASAMTVSSPVATIAPTPVASPTPAASPVAQASPIASPLVLASPTPAASIAPSTTTAPVSITGTSYTIVHGDTLWDIAERAYGDPYQWTKIAEANKLENPDLIHADNVLTLPR